MIAGDLVSTVSTIVIDPPEGHMGQYLESLERAAALLGEDAVLHPSHGPVSSDGRKLLRRYIEHRDRREEALVKALESGVSESKLTALSVPAREVEQIDAHRFEQRRQ